MNVIVAADQNWGIGKDNKLLVSIPADMKMFREETSGKVVVMGRKTLESFPNGLPLKNRTNIVITKNKDYDAKGAIVVHSIEEALEEIKKYPTEDVYCIGGDSIYEQMLHTVMWHTLQRLTSLTKQTATSRIWMKMMNGRLRQRAMSRHILTWNTSL